MHYEINYVDKTPEDAIKDCKKWLGTKQFNFVVKALKNDNGTSSRQLIKFCLSIQGIQGYPADAMIDKYWNPQQEFDLTPVKTITDEQFEECGWQLGTRTI
jgi:hypothetical protein